MTRLPLNWSERNGKSSNEKPGNGSPPETKPLSIEEFAKETLIALGMWRVPVDPYKIIKEEGIDLAAGKYGEKFDARIEYVNAADAFILYYRTALHGRTEGRVRFSLAHELGHFYLPTHREYLLRGSSHNSVSDFRSRDPRETEADEFASSLLMPRDLFTTELRKNRRKFWTLSDLRRMADEVFETSITSTVRRYCQLDFEPCAMVISESGRVSWSRCSESMRPLGMSFIRNGSQVPPASRTAKVWEQLGVAPTLEPVRGPSSAHTWYENPYRDSLWEEAMPLGYTGLVLTLLALQESDPDD